MNRYRKRVMATLIILCATLLFLQQAYGLGLVGTPSAAGVLPTHEAHLRYQPPRPAPSPPPIGSPLRPAPSADQPSTGFPVQILPVIGLVLAFVVVVLLLARFASLLASRRKKPAHLQKAAAAGAGGLVFAGKLDLYIIEGTIDDYTDTIQPRTFTLAHSHRVSVQTILKKCRLPNAFPGSDQIYFIATAHGSLQIRNHSDCAISVGSDVLAKNKSYLLLHKGNVRIRDMSARRELIISPRFLYRA